MREGTPALGYYVWRAERSGKRRSGPAGSAITALAVTALTGCAAGGYPTKSEVERARAEVPALDTIAEGRGYLAAVRKNMIGERNNLQAAELGLDAGIVGGLVTVGLGTVLHWGAHASSKAGIFTAALVGVESTLSLKTQVQIINKGLDALICIESQAEAAYVQIQPYDALTAPITADIERLQKTIENFEKQDTDRVLSGPLTAAMQDLTAARFWLARESVPVATVNAGVKIGVDSVIQATVDQMSSTLPDGSAFARISTTFPAPPAPPGQTPPPPTTSPTHAPADKQTLLFNREGEAPSQTPSDAEGELMREQQRLNADMMSASRSLHALGPVSAATQLPTINCPLAPPAAAPAQPPRLTHQTPTPAATWHPGQQSSFQLPAGSFADPQGQALTYKAQSGNGQPLPDWLRFDPATLTFSGLVPTGASSFQLTVTATNASGLSASDTFGITVQ